MIAALALAAAVATPPPQQLEKIVVQAPKAVLTLQVAQSEEERERGLMSVTNLPRHTGMVFVFDGEQPVEFWMKDTLVPLDMVFVGADGTVHSVAAKVPVVPLDTPDEKIPRRGGVGKFVVELPAGEARADGIVAGTKLRFVIPSLPPPPSTPYADGPFSCSMPISDPAPGATTAKISWQDVGKSESAQSDLDFAGAFASSFGLAGTFTLPRVDGNQGLFYSNWLLLKELKGNNAFVQLELMRWKKYSYRNEVALTWALPDGELVYRDTGLFVNDDPHELAIAVDGDSVIFAVDGASLCSAPVSTFFPQRKALFFEVGTEVSRPGDKPAGTVSNLRIKQDTGAWKTAYASCIYHGYGLSWRPDANASTFTATGAFDTSKPYLLFTGLTDSAPCVL